MAEELHFARAADRLNIAQPSLSRQIRNLEDELGTLLLDRGSRHVALTAAGRLFLAEAKTILRDVEHAAETARRGQVGEIGTLKIGFVSIVALSTLPELIETFRNAFPLVELELSELPSELQVESILEGTLDVGIIRQPFSIVETLSSCRVSEDAQVVALPKRHRLAEEATVDIRDLHAESFVTFSRKGGPATYDSIISACARAGFSPHVVQEAQRITTIVGLVSAGAGVAILPPAAMHICQPNVVYRPLVPKLIIETGLVWNHAQIRERPTLKAFLKSVIPAEASRVGLAPRKTSGPSYRHRVTPFRLAGSTG